MRCGLLFVLMACTVCAQDGAAVSLAPTCKNGATLRLGGEAPAGLSVSNVAKLSLKWAFNLGTVKVARAEPTVVDGWLFITTQAGVVYALDARNGCTRWGFKAGKGIRSGVAMGDANGKAAAFFSDEGGTMYALDAQTGSLIWQARPTTNVATHIATLATAEPRYYEGVVYQPYASFEETLAGNPKYECCTFRGSVAALDADTGKTLWQTFTIPEAAAATGKTAAGVGQSGPSGAGVWSSPTIDAARGVLYVATETIIPTRQRIRATLCSRWI